MSGIKLFFSPVRRLSNAWMKQVCILALFQKWASVFRTKCITDVWKECFLVIGHWTMTLFDYLQKMRPQLSHWPSLDVPQILHQLDHLLDASSVIQDLPLHIMKIQLKNFLISSVECNCHEASQWTQLSHSLMQIGSG